MKEILDNPKKYPHVRTCDDFFDFAKIPKSSRSDFLMKSIMNGVKKLKGEPSITFEEYCNQEGININFIIQ